MSKILKIKVECVKKCMKMTQKGKYVKKSMIRSFVTHIIFNRAFHTLVDVIINFVLKKHSALLNRQPSKHVFLCAKNEIKLNGGRACE